jgi:hypothetical protein
MVAARRRTTSEPGTSGWTVEGRYPGAQAMTPRRELGFAKYGTRGKSVPPREGRPVTIDSV